MPGSFALQRRRTCPNCHQLFDLDAALGFSGWSKLAPSNCGVRCPNCQIILAVRQRPGLAIFWGVLFVVSAILLTGQVNDWFSRTEVAVMQLGLVVFALLMFRWKVRSLIELRVPPPGVDLREVTPSAREYRYLEGKDGQGDAFQPDPTAREDQLPEWTCPNCAQANPASFDLCWKCNHRRPVRTA